MLKNSRRKMFSALALQAKNKAISSLHFIDLYQNHTSEYYSFNASKDWLQLLEKHLKKLNKVFLI